MGSLNTFRTGFARIVATGVLAGLLHDRAIRLRGQ